MPRMRKLSPTEIVPLDQSSISSRARVAREYDAYLADFVAGDYGRIELREDERRILVRQRLQVAARRRGLVFRFRSDTGPLKFRVEAAPALVEALPVGAQPTQSMALAQCDEISRPNPQPPRPPRPARQRLTAAERYRDVLPRRMREGQPLGRRGDSKRRQGR